MTDFQAYSSTHRVHPTNDWNPLLDHGLEKTASYIIRRNGSYYEAINGSTGKISYGGSGDAGGVTGTNAGAVIQSAIDAIYNVASGTVILVPSTTFFFYGEQLPLIMRDLVDFKGTDWSTVLKLRNGENQNAATFIKFQNNARKIKISDLQIDGNQVNNDLNWADRMSSPTAHGIWFGDDSGQATMTNCRVNNVYIHDTVRSNIVFGGLNCTLSNSLLENSLCDHQLYMASPVNCWVDKVLMRGFFANEVVPWAYDAEQTTMQNCTIKDLVANPNSYVQPWVIRFRSGGVGAGAWEDNKIEGCIIRDDNGLATHTIEIQGGTVTEHGTPTKSKFIDNLIISGKGGEAMIRVGANATDWSFLQNRIYNLVATGAGIQILSGADRFNIQENQFFMTGSVNSITVTAETADITGGIIANNPYIHKTLNIQGDTAGHKVKNLIVANNRCDYISIYHEVQDSIIKNNFVTTTFVLSTAINGIGNIIKDNILGNPLGLAAGGQPFDTTNNRLRYRGNTATPTASNDYVVNDCDIYIHSSNSGDANCAIIIKDGAGNQVYPRTGTASILDGIYVPWGYKINWGAFTGTAPIVVISFC